MNICINKSLPEFQDLLKETGLKENILTAKIAVWQIKNNTDSFPSSDQLIENKDSTLEEKRAIGEIRIPPSRKIKGKNLADTDALVEDFIASFNGLLYKKIYTEDLGITFIQKFLTDSKTFSDTYKEIVSTIKNLYEQIVSESYVALLNDNIPAETKSLFLRDMELYLDVLNDFDTLVRRAQKHFEKFGITFDAEESMTEDEKDSKDSVELWQKEQIKVNPKTRAPSVFRFLISSLSTASQIQTSNLLLDNNKRVDFGTVTSILINNLAGTRSLEESISIIENLEKRFNETDSDLAAAFSELIQKLFTIPVKDENGEFLRNEDGSVKRLNFSIDNFKEFPNDHLRFLMQFFSYLNNNFNNYKHFQYDENGKVVLFDGNLAAQRQKIKIQARKQFALTYGPRYLTGAGTQQVFDKEKLASSIFFQGPTLMNSGFVDENIINSKEKQFEAVKTFFKFFGFKIPNIPYTAVSEADLENLYDAAYNLYSSVKNKKVESFYISETDFEGYLNRAVDFIVNRDPSQYENSYVRTGGERLYNVALHSTFSRTINAINKTPSLEELKRTDPYLFTEYSKNSQILKRGGVYFDEEGNRRPNAPFKFEFLDEIGKLDAGKNNTTYDKASSREKLMANFNATLKNQHPIFRQGDNQSQRHLKYLSPLHVTGETVKVEYLIDEIDHILLLLHEADQQSSKDDVNKYKGIDYENLDFFIERYPMLDILFNSEINFTYKGRSFTLTQFKKLIEENKAEDIYKILADPENIEAIQSGFDSFMGEKAELLLDKMILEEGVVLTYENKYNPRYLDAKVEDTSVVGEGVGLEKNEMLSLLKNGIINQFYSDIEVSKLLAGPFIFYKDSDNLFVRMAGLVGTKTILLDSPLANKIIEYLKEDQGAPAYWKQDLYGGMSLDAIPEKYSEYQSLDEDGNIVIDRDSSGNATVKLLLSADPNSVSYMLDTLKNPDIVGIITDAYENMDEGDAFAFASLDFYKELFERAGMWSEGQEKLYQWYNRPFRNEPLVYRNSKKGTTEIIRSRNEIRNADGSIVVFTVAKPQHFGPLIEKGFPPGMHKLSLMPILPEYVEEYPSFASVQKTLDQNNAGILLFPTANKVGTAVNEQGQVPSTYKPKDGKVREGGEAVVDISDAIVQYTFAKNWGVQLSTGTSFKIKVTTGSQLAKVIFINIYEDGKIKEGKEHLASLGEDLLLVNQSLIELELENLINRFGINLRQVDGEEIYDIENEEELINFLIEEISKRDIPSSMIESLEIIRDNSELSDALRFDVLSNREKLENILAAIADSRVISRKTNGASKVQASSVFFEVDGIRKYANEQAQLLSGTLKFYEEGVMEVMLPHWFKEYFSRAIGVDVEEINLKDLHSKIEEVAPELLKAVGFRIPTSGLNSVEAIKIVGFLPESAGETIVVPAEIVAKAGSDFDVDKLNLFFANYIFNYETGLPEYVKFIDPEDYKTEDGEYNAVGFLQAVKENRGIEEETFVSDILKILPEDTEELKKELFKLNSAQALENRRLEIMHTIISDTKNRKDLLESIGIELLKEQEERVREEQGIPDSKKTARDVFADVAYKAEVDVRNIDSKKLTGVASLHLVDLAHAQKYGYAVEIEGDILKFFGNKDELKNLGIKMLEEKLSDGSTRTYANVSLGRQTNVDGIKLSTILNQSVNAAVDGVKNPIFYNLNLTLETSSVAFLLIRAGFSLNKVFDFVAHPAIKRWSKKVQNNKGESRSRLKKDLLETFKEEGLDEKILEEYKEIIDLYEKLNKGAASKLNTYIQSTRLDTQAAGKNTTQLEILLYSAYKVASGESGIINAEKIYMPGGFLHPHYTALNAFKSMFSELFLVQDTSIKNVAFSSAYSHIVDYILKNLTYTTLDEKSRILDSLKNYLITHTVLTAPSIKLKNFQTDRPLNTNIDLISGENSVAKRIENIKKRIIDSNGIVKKEGITDNSFLNILNSNVSPEGYKVTKKGVTEDPSKYETVYIDTVYPLEQRFDSTEIDQMQDSFRELFDHPIIKKLDPNLPYDIVQVMFLQGGLQNSPLSLLKFVPSEIYMEFIYKAYKSLYTDSTEIYGATSNLILNFLASNYNNGSLFGFKRSFRGRSPNNLFITVPDPVRKVNKVYINATYANQEKDNDILSGYISSLYPDQTGLKEFQSNTIIDFKNTSYILLPTSNPLGVTTEGKKVKTAFRATKRAAGLKSALTKIWNSAKDKKRLPPSYWRIRKTLANEIGPENVDSYLRRKPSKRNTKKSYQRNKSCRGK